MKKKLFTLFFTVAVVVSLASVSAANTITVGLQQAGVNGGAITQVFSSPSGNLVFGTSYGSFIINNITATGSPFLPQPELQTTSVNASTTTGGVLKVYITEQGLSSTLDPFVSGFTTNNFLGNVNLVTLATFIDPLNGLFTGAPLASQSFTSIGSATSSNLAALSGLFSETAVYTIDLGAPSPGETSSANSTINLSAVPEPSSTLLFGTGLSGLAMLLRRRRANQVKMSVS